MRTFALLAVLFSLLVGSSVGAETGTDSLIFSLEKIESL